MNRSFFPTSSLFAGLLLAGAMACSPPQASTETEPPKPPVQEQSQAPLTGTLVPPSSFPVVVSGHALQEKITLTHAMFKGTTAGIRLSAEGLRVVAHVAENYQASEAPLILQVTGYSSSLGARNTNILLSHRRAEAVQRALVQDGIPADRIMIRGLGPDHPIASNATQEGRLANQRVEIDFLPLNP